MNVQFNLLVIDDEPEIRISLKTLLERNGYKVSVAATAKRGFEICSEKTIDCIICDIILTEMSGLTFLEKIDSDIPVIMITAYGSIETTRKAFKLGARDYLVKPFELDELLVVIKQNLDNGCNQNFLSDDKIIYKTNNSEMQNVFYLLDKFSQTDISVLLTGESGVGKDIFARYIHENSERRGHPFISINCAAIPDTLLESEFFGYEKGAFSGAIAKKTGKFEEANGGTIFLDEIGDMPIILQAKLLRVLQNFQFSRLGGHEVVSVDVRIIAATNKDLLLEDGRSFRMDLYHRLNGINIDIPPLKRRKEDIPLLIQHFILLFSQKYKKSIKELEPSALEVLKAYDWPGNIRELRNAVERAFVICDTDYISIENFPNLKVNMRNQPTTVSITKKMDDYRLGYMRDIVIDALKKANGNRTEAAKLLNISRKTLYLKMKELQIENEFK